METRNPLILNSIFDKDGSSLFSYFLRNDMTKIYIHAYYFFGIRIGRLEQIIEGTTLWFAVYNGVRQVQNDLHEICVDRRLPFRLCKDSALSLLNELNTYFPKDVKEFEEIDLQREFTKIEADRISGLVASFHSDFNADSRLMHNYTIPERGIYSIDTLLERGEMLIGENILSVLPSQIIEELKQFGQAFAFNIPTSAGFHLIRSLEWVLRYYVVGLGGSLGEPKDRSWGNYINSIEKNSADSRMVIKWRELKDEYRNDLMHPESNLTIEQIFVLIETAHTLIRGTVADVERKKDPNSPLAKLYPKPKS